MATDSAQFDFDDKAWRDIIKKIEKKWDDVSTKGSQFVGIVSAVVFKDITRHFEDEKGPDGSWDQWSKAYSEHMKKIGKGGRKKLQSGNPPSLKMKILPENNPEGMPWRKRSDGILFFNNAKTKDGFAYAKHHDEGRSSWMGNSRKFMWLSKEGGRDISAQVSRWLSEGI